MYKFFQYLSHRFIINLLVIFMIFVVVFVCNNIPDGYIIAWGDFQSFINPAETIQHYKYIRSNTWLWFSSSLHASVLFYLGKYILHLIWWSATSIVNIYTFFLLVLSYFSFSHLCASFGIKDLKYQVFWGLLYSLGVGSLAFFSYTRWYNHHVIIFTLLPLSISFAYKNLSNDNISIVDMCKYLITCIVITAAYNNVAFIIVTWCSTFLLYITFFHTSLWSKKYVFLLLLLCQGSSIIHNHTR